LLAFKKNGPGNAIAGTPDVEITVKESDSFSLLFIIVKVSNL
jgi:hypothetical protein